MGRMPSSLALGIDAGDGILCLGDVVEEGDADLLEFDILELGHQAVAERFGGQAGAVGDEEYGAFDRIGHAPILTAVAQPGSDAVDRQMDAAGDPLVGFAGAVALEQLDLQVVQRVHVGRAQLQRTLEHRIVGEEIVLFEDGQQVLFGSAPIRP
jgi:hypothetical protein